ncbi:hypothetical protein vseg_014424 [Gypsophila vaccaria]
MGSNKESAYMLYELKYATNNFSQISLLGKGSNSWVYYAYLATTQEAVVKKLDFTSSLVTDADFHSQLSVVSELSHENLTGLLGYCMEDDNRYLVYEYAPLGSLHDALYGRKGLEGAEPGPVLSWAQRAKIAYDAAKGLEYLHEEASPSIAHGDVRSSNVLLFNDDIAKIADFNLARDPRSCSTRALGYDGPEYTTTGEKTKKGDIYSFAVVLLELLTGRKPVDDTLPEEQQDLVTWATPYLSDDKVEEIIDPKLNGDFPLRAVAKVAALAGLCLQEEPDFRPNMTIMAMALKPPEDEPEESIEAECEETVKVYTMDELNEMTNNFSYMSLLAKTSIASVFRTYYKNGPLTAVKKLDMSIVQDSDTEFEAQLSVVTKLKHIYLTELLGYCLEENNRILVYELATMGSLHDVLYGRKQIHGAEPGPDLTWERRARIAYGAAKGLEYLHETVNPPIVHGDVRSSNVLMFESLIPGGYYSKIADFHLTSALLGDAQVDSADDDLGADDDLTEKRTPKSDVYGFGVVLLELLTGRKPVDDTMPEEQQDLVTWATAYLNAENVEQILDPKLDNGFSLEDVAKVAEIAGLCLRDEPDLRPEMSTVVEILETIVDV